MYVEASTDGLPVIVAKLEGVAVYLDNWAIIGLANGDAKRRERFLKALRSCGSLLFSFTNSIELGEAEREPAERVRTFLDEIGANWMRSTSLERCIDCRSDALRWRRLVFQNQNEINQVPHAAVRRLAWTRAPHRQNDPCPP
jgi:hypothetical protein